MAGFSERNAEWGTRSRERMWDGSKSSCGIPFNQKGVETPVAIGDAGLQHLALGGTAPRVRKRRNNNPSLQVRSACSLCGAGEIAESC